MSIEKNIIRIAQDTIANEIAALEKMKQAINPTFEAVINSLHACNGRVVITGIGKSALIAQKIVATMNSTGTPALFMHAADAIHGDLGMIQEDDVVIIISKSGESPEIKALIPFIRNFGNKIIAICGKDTSYLATHADYFLDTTIDQEACPNNLAPTTSTTAQLVMGDALAVCLLQLKGFTAKDFAKYHPGGALGKRLYLRVADMSEQNPKPFVTADANLKEVILSISANRLGATAVLENDRLVGVITDGDLRRMLEKHIDFTTLRALDICTKNPKTVEADDMAVVALEQLRTYNITQLLVTKDGAYAGMVHLHDLIKEGLI
ncbi:D-arabinose 5-phosphate isomerase [Taibaiella sp. KBW10]|uniref:KpsF/GutQ family sugar-phosphate isomerase n=1 Tax=Taibaiella sp. KBW10 TaxID=2153357 RepID=UPI000F594362|nr:KpsF/GutQ family sugar-phosphate isomerase [Taibaiella sp. KBW10]RQO31635.1 D-arabinose 5-phosphate isomerase [Taibaiella sp. KBW10]